MPQCTLPFIYNLTSSKFSVIMSMISGTPVHGSGDSVEKPVQKAGKLCKPDDVTVHSSEIHNGQSDSIFIKI